MSMIPRTVCTKACRASRSPSDAKPRAISSRSRPGRRPARPSRRATEAPAFRSGSAHSSGQHVLGGREGGRAQQEVHLLAEAAARDEHQPLHPLRELVGELHRHPAAERVAHDRRLVDAERDQQVAHAAGVGAERVVAAGLRGLAVPEQVGRDHRVVLRQRWDHVLPGPRAAGDAVDQHERRSGARAAEAHPMPVQLTTSSQWRGHWICTPEIARAITSRWISDVPSKIV